MKILIADDSEVIRKRIKKLLSSFKEIEIICEASTVTETKKLIGKIQLDLILLDFSMPDGNALDVLNSIPKFPDKPIVILLTNYSFQEYRHQCYLAGADYFFDKGTEFRRVKEVIMSLIDQSSNPPNKF